MLLTVEMCLKRIYIKHETVLYLLNCHIQLKRNINTRIASIVYQKNLTRVANTGCLFGYLTAINVFL